MPQLPLDQVANEINARLKLADKAEDHRIAAGCLLLEAQERIQSGQELNKSEQPWLWGQWCARFITGRTDRDIRRCIALVKSDDPEVAREREKHQNRVTKHRSRTENRTDCPIPHPDPVEPVPPPSASLDALIAAVKDLPTPDFDPFKAWFRGYCGA